jgi:folate-binding Fe-S cluster repair protein YgfZ
VFVYQRDDNQYLIEVDQSASQNLEKMLKLYRLRRKIEISQTDLNVGFTIDSEAKDSMQDPRVSGFGRRVLGDFSSAEHADNDYLMRRLEWGIPEGADELTDQIPLYANGDIMNGISFDKGLFFYLKSLNCIIGCYVGQELIARTHHTGVVRRRILPFKCSKQVTGQIVGEDGKKQGKVIKSVDNLGLALLPVKSVGEKLFVDRVSIDVYRPKWWSETIQ